MANERSHLALPARTHLGERKQQGLSISVVFTNERATLAALKRAAELASELDARIRIVVPQVVPYLLPIDRPHVDPEFRVRRFLDLSVKVVPDFEIDVRLCRDPWVGLTQALRPESIVIIGGRQRRLTRESRLMRRLALADFDVVFVPQS